MLYGKEPPEGQGAGTAAQARLHQAVVVALLSAVPYGIAACGMIVRPWSGCTVIMCKPHAPKAAGHAAMSAMQHGIIRALGPALSQHRDCMSLLWPSLMGGAEIAGAAHAPHPGMLTIWLSCIATLICLHRPWCS